MFSSSSQTGEMYDDPPPPPGTISSKHDMFLYFHTTHNMTLQDTLALQVAHVHCLSARCKERSDCSARSRSASNTVSPLIGIKDKPGNCSSRFRSYTYGN
jgi:hypothetical protein